MRPVACFASHIPKSLGVPCYGPYGSTIPGTYSASRTEPANPAKKPDARCNRPVGHTASVLTLLISREPQLPIRRDRQVPTAYCGARAIVTVVCIYIIRPTAPIHTSKKLEFYSDLILISPFSPSFYCCSQVARLVLLSSSPLFAKMLRAFILALAAVGVSSLPQGKSEDTVPVGFGLYAYGPEIGGFTVNCDDGLSTPGSPPVTRS